MKITAKQQEEIQQLRRQLSMAKSQKEKKRINALIKKVVSRS